MIIYHGSTVPVEVPKIMNSERKLDFGSFGHQYIVRDIDEFIATNRKQHLCQIYLM